MPNRFAEATIKWPTNTHAEFPANFSTSHSTGNCSIASLLQSQDVAKYATWAALPVKLPATLVRAVQAAQAVAEETQAVGPAFGSYRRRSPSAQSALRAGQLECRSPASHRG